MADVRIRNRADHEIDTVLAEDIDFTGVITFEKPLKIKGKVTGEIKATGDLYIDDKAVVNAEIEANVVSSKGEVNGNIVAHSRVELFSTANVKGDIRTPEIEIESGSHFNGQCRMGKTGNGGYDEK